MKTIYRPLALLLALCAIMTAAPENAFGQNDENAIKARILERVKDVDALKMSGAVGENNKGFLEQRAGLNAEQTKIMNEENADRRALYTILARRLGLSATVVGQGRAESIRKKSAPKVWLQDPGGNWFQN